MKKKKLLKVIIGIAVSVFVCAAAGGISYFIRVQKTNTLIKQQNYVASKLLELGDYEQGRILAAQSEQLKENITSKQLLVLAAGFQSEYQTGIRYIERYLEEVEDEILLTAKNVLESFLTSEATLEEADYSVQYDQLKANVREELLTLLLQVQNSIDVKVSNVNIQAMLDMMSAQSTGVGSNTIASLQDDNSGLSNKVQAVYAIQTGDYITAREKAEEAFESDKSFENRAMLANIIANESTYTQEQDNRISELSEELYELNNKLSELNTKYQQTISEAEKLKLAKQMETVESKATSVKNTIESEPAYRAINFIETTTPIIERDSVAYKIELAQLYFQAKEEEKAQEILIDIIKKDDDSSEPAAMLMEDLIELYLMNSGQMEKPAYYGLESISIEVFWNRISELLCFVDNSYYYDSSKSFYQFMLGVLDTYYNGLVIREIDATDFPTVRVTVNVAMDLEKKLDKSNFALTEMNSPITDFRILSEEEMTVNKDMSVVLVVDKSGSMSGSPLEDTKKAVANFVKNVEENIRIGLVAFDDSAEVVAPISDNRTSILKGVASIYDEGGTSIYLGLQKGGEELADESGKKVIILLSDGADGDASRIDAVLEDLKRKNIYVYTIGFGGADTDYLSYIATSCGGKFIQADSSEVLGEIYAAIGEYMVNDYIIEFTIVVDPSDFSRIVNVSVDVNNAYAEEEYNVGVPFEDIENEVGEAPLANYFWQVGGSWRETP